MPCPTDCPLLPVCRLKGLHGEARDVVASQHVWAFRQFGVAAAALDAVPLANWLTAFSNTVGAALWAADQEAAGRVLVRRGVGEREEEAPGSSRGR